MNAAAAIARPAAKALVNALLRRYLREREALHAAVRQDPVARWSHPQWWIDRVQADYPDAGRRCSPPATSARRCRCA